MTLKGPRKAQPERVALRELAQPFDDEGPARTWFGAIRWPAEERDVHRLPTGHAALRREEDGMSDQKATRLPGLPASCGVARRSGSRRRCSGLRRSPIASRASALVWRNQRRGR